MPEAVFFCIENLWSTLTDIDRGCLDVMKHLPVPEIRPPILGSVETSGHYIVSYSLLLILS